jgi:LacI family transcriptional regulator
VLQVDVYDAQRPFLAEFLAGVTKKASSENWSLTVSTAMSENETLETYERLIDERKADGFILPRTKVNDRRVALLKSAHVPFVLFGRTGDDDDCAWYDILSEQAMSDAVVRLFEFGHRRIAFVKSGMEYYYSTLRLKGYKQGLAKVGLEYDETYVSSEAMTKEQGRVETDRLLRLKEPPTAILYAVDMAALGAYAAAASLGLKIGADLSVIGYDGVPDCSYTVPPMTTFEVDTRRAGERLAHLLISRIRGAAAESLRETEFASLNARSSDGPATLSTEELARIVRANSGHENILGGKT